MAIACSSTALMAPPPLLRTKPSSPSSSCYYSVTSSASLASRASLLFSGGGGILRPVARRRRSGGRGGGGGALGSRCLFGLGVPELVVIAGVAALVFGPKKLPEIGRSIGKTVKSFQQAAKEFETEIKKDSEDASQPAPSETPKTIKSEDEKKELEASSGTKESI
ncbi:sec-independent protein translocase protein TATA, chloroplastic [Ananas comosus]|uniref:Sec-independent protein translocase protein TATA, chloroplastic n=1 Tax=Ananas comosus TaxID=4615 RepID=A0A199VPG4_ANACO|nr:sec-independent protein translocase protein TATA, chloroplastic [Ananas comosus]OAY78954.1 Sec-independent protein translocase protein TATA, chloroplastic [Ananas comosus]